MTLTGSRRARSRLRGSSEGLQELTPTGGGSRFLPADVAIDPDGNAIAVWDREVGPNPQQQRIQASIGP